MKTLYCLSITSSALRLIRSFEGDVIGDQAQIYHVTREEPSCDRHGNIVEGAFKIFFPDNRAICYTLSGEISFVL